MKIRLVKLILLNTFFIFLLDYEGLCQTSLIGIHITPNIIGQPKIDNSSPTRLYGENRISFDAGLDYTRFLKKKPYGLRLGLGVGIVDYNYVFEAPRNAFGKMTGEGNIYANDNFDNYAYASLSLAFVYQFKIKNLQLKTYLGASKKFYEYANESFDYGYAFNRDQPYDFNDPNAGSPDLLIHTSPSYGRLHVDIPLGIGIVRKYSDKSSLTMGLVKNWNINPIAIGNLFVQAYGKSYTGGEFSPRSSYIGLDIRYSYGLGQKKVSKSSNSAEKKKDEKFTYKKAVFIEALGAGGIGSANLDLRLNKNHNDGFGVRLGFGKGEFFESNETNNTNRYSSLPIGLNYIKGKKQSGIELGLGVSPQFTFSKVINGPKISALGFLTAGYRFQPLKEGLLFRAAWNPYISTLHGLNSSWYGISIGYGFK